MAERKIEYQVLEHKADTGFLVTAPSLQRLYIDAALALTDQMVRLDAIEEREKRTLAASGANREELIVKWLNEILFLFEKEKILCKRILFDLFDGKNIKATIHGEKYDALRHGGLSEIKAVTFHQLQVGDRETPEPHFFARIFLDL